jgi:hypothetical protein
MRAAMKTSLVNLSDKISAALTDVDGSESLAIHISGIPAGASLIGAHLDIDSGDWIIDDLANLKIVLPAGSDADFDLTVKAISTEASNSDSAMVSAVLHIDVNAVADDPTLVVIDASGDEDTLIDLSGKVSAALVDLDGSESLAIHIADVPVGATLNGAHLDVGSGEWIVDDLSLLAIKAPLHSDVDFDLTVKAISTEASNSDSAMVSAVLHIDVNAVADDPTLVVIDASGDEDTLIDLSGKVSAALVDLDGSESLAIHIADVPVGGYT